MMDDDYDDGNYRGELTAERGDRKTSTERTEHNNQHQNCTKVLDSCSQQEKLTDNGIAREHVVTSSSEPEWTGENLRSSEQSTINEFNKSSTKKKDHGSTLKINYASPQAQLKVCQSSNTSTPEHNRDRACPSPFSVDKDTTAPTWSKRKRTNRKRLPIIQSNAAFRWNCQACTLLNEGYTTACRLCGTPLTTHDDRMDDRSDIRNIVTNSSNTWTMAKSSTPPTSSRELKTFSIQGRRINFNEAIDVENDFEEQHEDEDGDNESESLDEPPPLISADEILRPVHKCFPQSHTNKCDEMENHEVITPQKLTKIRPWRTRFPINAFVPWVCRACTFQNVDPMYDNFCEMCDSINPTAKDGNQKKLCKVRENVIDPRVLNRATRHEIRQAELTSKQVFRTENSTIYEKRHSLRRKKVIDSSSDDDSMETAMGKSDDTQVEHANVNAKNIDPSTLNANIKSAVKQKPELNVKSSSTLSIDPITAQNTNKVTDKDKDTKQSVYSRDFDETNTLKIVHDSSEARLSHHSPGESVWVDCGRGTLRVLRSPKKILTSALALPICFLSSQVQSEVSALKIEFVAHKTNKMHCFTLTTDVTVDIYGASHACLVCYNVQLGSPLEYSTRVKRNLAFRVHDKATAEQLQKIFQGR